MTVAGVAAIALAALAVGWLAALLFALMRLSDAIEEVRCRLDAREATLIDERSGSDSALEGGSGGGKAFE